MQSLLLPGLPPSATPASATLTFGGPADVSVPALDALPALKLDSELSKLLLPPSNLDGLNLVPAAHRKEPPRGYLRPPLSGPSSHHDKPVNQARRSKRLNPLTEEDPPVVVSIHVCMCSLYF